MATHTDKIRARTQLHHHYDANGMRRPECVGDWQLKKGVISYPAYRWQRWEANLSAFGSHDELVSHVRMKVWAGRECLAALRRLLEGAVRPH